MIQRWSPFTNTSLSSRKHDTCGTPGAEGGEGRGRRKGGSSVPYPHSAALTSPLFSMSHLFMIFIAYTWPVCFIFTTAT